MQRVPVMQSASEAHPRVHRLTPPTVMGWHESSPPQSDGPVQRSNNVPPPPPDDVLEGAVVPPALDVLDEVEAAPPVPPVELVAPSGSHWASTLQT
jgi:hypothetical protein